MIAAGDGGPDPALDPVPVPTVPPVNPPVPATVPPVTTMPPVAPTGNVGPDAVNSHGENLAEAEAAVYALVAGGMLPTDALALHPLPPGTSPAQALAFLASLPQTTTQFTTPGSTVITGPPLTGPVDDPYNVDPLPDPSAWNGFEFAPFYGIGGGLSEEAANAKILRGAAFTTAMINHCHAMNIDAKAAAANALGEGLGGGIGDQGTAYGPWQIHAEDGRISQFAGLPPYAPVVQGWAWTDNGIEYAIRSMKAGGAAGKVGHAAVYAIVYGFERPADKAGAVAARNVTYDALVAKGSSWDEYVANIAGGPSLQATPTGGPVSPPATQPPTTIKGRPIAAAWREFIYTFSRDMPFAANHARTVADGLIDIIR